MEKPGLENIPRNLTGLGATVISFYFLVTQREDLAIVAASIFFVLACAIDTVQARIPNFLTVSLAVAGVTINAINQGMPGAIDALLGFSLGFILLLLPYLMGGFGAGDVKALAALGAVVGPGAILHIFVYMAFFGGAMAILHYTFNSNLKEKVIAGWESVQASVLTRSARYLKPGSSEPLRFPYAAAIAFGYYSYIHWGGIL